MGHIEAAPFFDRPDHESLAQTDVLSIPTSAEDQLELSCTGLRVRCERELLDPQNAWIENSGQRARAIEKADLEREMNAIVYARYWQARSLFALGLNKADLDQSQLLFDEAHAQIKLAREQAPKELGSLDRLSMTISDHQNKSTGNSVSISKTESKKILPQTLEKEAYKLPQLDRLYLAAELSSQGEQAKSLNVLESFSSEGVLNFSAWLMKGHAHREMGNLSDAISCYSVCETLERDSPWPCFFRGIVYLEKRDFAKAKSDFDKVINRDDSTSARLNRALAYQGLAELENAIADLDVAIENGCIETRAYYLRHRLHKKLGQAEEAKRDLETFLAIDPIDEKSWLSRGMAQISIKMPKQALEDFHSALEINPYSTKAYENIATVQAEFLHHTDQAIEAMTSIVEQQPENVVAIATRGVLLGRIGNRDSAIGDAKMCLRLSQSADTLFRVAGIFALTSQINEKDRRVAIDLLQKASLADGKLVFRKIKSDKDLDAIRRLPEFEAVVKTLEKWGQPLK